LNAWREGVNITDPVAEILFNYLRELLYNPSRATLDIYKLPEGFRDLGKGMLYFAECINETMTLAKELANGDLNGKPPSRGNEMAAPLKSLHATLKHLTWQVQQVSKGDYRQRVSFMGDFSKAFNSMVEQLEQQRLALLDEIEQSYQKARALTQSNNLFEAITDQITQWIIVMSKKDKRWLFVNHKSSDILSDSKLEQQLRLWLEQRAEIIDNKPQTAEVELSSGDKVQYFSVDAHPLYWYEHDSIAFVLTDISSEKEHLHRLENAAYRDTLTKVFNRHYGMNVLNEWLAQNKSFIICFVDMDNLKYVNDKHGHAEGDNYILLVVSVLRDFSPSSIICRLGGDEFMLLEQNCSMSDAEARMEDLRASLIRYNDEPGAFYNHSLSYGVVEVTFDSTLPASELLSIADEKMYAYKRAHRAQRGNSSTGNL
jgi:diguanylate cyclase (GGDEF)-like protein